MIPRLSLRHPAHGLQHIPGVGLARGDLEASAYKTPILSGNIRTLSLLIFKVNGLYIFVHCSTVALDFEATDNTSMFGQRCKRSHQGKAGAKKRHSYLSVVSRSAPAGPVFIVHLSRLVQGTPP